MENEIQVTKQALPVYLIQEAIAKGADLSQLRELLEIQKDYEANEARKAYNKAMAAFKANPPKIDKDRHVGYSTAKGSRVGYSHASLYNVVDKITAELSKYGLSSSWRTEQNNNQIKVSCRISHELGHFEETSLTADADNSGAKNSIQAIGSTVTYLQRYSLLSLTGLATYDQDNDGQLPEDKIDENKVKILNDLIKELEVDLPKFLEYLAVEKVEDIPSSAFAKAKMALEAKRRGKK
jgi:hypothetical protein